MLFEDKEANLIEYFRAYMHKTNRPVHYLPDTTDIRAIVTSLVDVDIWQAEWVDNSSKSAPPPDFYNKSQKLMMEVMRIDDHAFEQGKKIINPTIKRARMKEKELREALGLSPNVELFINSPTDLPSFEDHNYRYYKYNFKRVIEGHKKHISQYRSNHPGYKLIFFVFDESSMYCQTDIPNRTIKKDEQFTGVRALHNWHYDRAFINNFKNSGIDYLIWVTPYKWIKRSEPPIENLPLACVFDCNRMEDDAIEYPDDYMMSMEE